MSSAPTGLRIAVVGAGSSGLLLSLILQRQGHRVTLFERSPRLRTEGCGILLVRSGVEAVAAAAIPVCSTPCWPAAIRFSGSSFAT